jgi:UDP-glucose:(heptosyl)LPS alpha-1,3-glucosyltransferase
MRIALVHMRSAQRGGTESFLNQLSAHLCERGHDVEIICRSHQGAPHPRVKFVVLKSLVPFASWRVLAFARDVARHVKRSDYDLVVGLGRTWSHDVIRMSGGCHATYLHHAHPHTHTGWRYWLSQLSVKHRIILDIEARALARGAYRKVIVNSTFVRDDVIQRYAVDEEMVQVIRNAVDLERYHPRHRDDAGRELRQSLGIAAASPVVLFLGTAFGRKGLDILLAAFAKLRADVPAARLMIVGRDAGMARWERLARELGLGDSVDFLGPRSDTEACYGAADLYVLPSRYDSFAYTVLEAMASGVPVVVSDAAGAADVVSPGAGTVVPWTTTPEELCEVLRSWCQPAALAAGRDAARSAAEGHGAHDAVTEMTALFEELALEKDASASSPVLG